MRRRLIVAVLVALLLPPVAAEAKSESRELVPGVIYTREVRRVNGGPVVIHSVVAPRPGGLYDLRPVLSNDLILGRERLTVMQQRLSGSATTAGVNGDLFTFETGHPSGILLEKGVLASRPLGGRSSLGITVDGLLRIGRIDFFGSWQVADGDRAPLAQFNRPLDRDRNSVGLFTWVWGGKTPRIKGATDVVVAGLPPTLPNADLAGQIIEVRRGGGTPIPQDGAVLQAIGFWADRLAGQAAPGLPVTLQLILKPWWEDVDRAIGGGPLLVREGKPVLRTDEDFRRSQLDPRHPRTAVGQLADGRIVLVAVDGRSRSSIGVRVPELARELVRLGAVTAMALDAGGSTTMAFDGRVLNRPSDGGERPLGNALMVFYYGSYVPQPRHGILSPNGDGVADLQTLAYRVVRPSTVDVKLVGPDDSVVWSDAGVRDPGTYPLELSEGLERQGLYRWSINAVDDEGRETGMTQSFRVNNTLGFLRLSKSRMKVRARRGGKLVVSFELGNAAKLGVKVFNSKGKLVRTLHRAKSNAPGQVVLIWDGRTQRKRVARTGRYTIRVRAVNELGRVTLAQGVQVKRVKRVKGKRS